MTYLMTTPHRSRPVVKMTGQVAFSLDSKQISLEQKNCTLRDGTRVPCVPLNAYLKYGGVNVDDAIGKSLYLIEINIFSSKC